MIQPRPRSSAALLMCVILSGGNVVQGAVCFDDVTPDWKEQAGRCVLAPLVCNADVNCAKVEKGFLKRAQEILVVESPEALRSFFLENSVEHPTTGEVLALAEELGFDSVLFGDSSGETIQTDSSSWATDPRTGDFADGRAGTGAADRPRHTR